ncbi:protein rogdi homolog isoform 2-T9 [Alca torda]
MRLPRLRPFSASLVARFQPARCALTSALSRRPPHVTAFGHRPRHASMVLPNQALSRPRCQAEGGAASQSGRRRAPRGAGAGGGMAAAMASAAERAVLEEEFKWLLQEEVHAVLKQLQDILKPGAVSMLRKGSATAPEGRAPAADGLATPLGTGGLPWLRGMKLERRISDAFTISRTHTSFSWAAPVLREDEEASHRFALPTSGSGGAVKQENFVLSPSGTDQVKGVLTLQGDALCQADVNLKMPRNNQLLHFAFREDKQWKLQQIQDARNHVNQAIYLLMNRDVNYQFKTGLEVLKLMDAVMLQLSRARNRLTTPATLTLPEIASSGLTKMFTPTLPPDILVNFYINLNKLCLTVYQLHVLQPSTTKNFKPAGGSILHNPGAMLCCCKCSRSHNELFCENRGQISVFSSYWNYRPY